MPQPTSLQSRGVSINGPALLAVCQLTGVEVADICAALDCHPSTISKLVNGTRRCSPRFLAELCKVLGVQDRRVFMACPYGAEAHELAAPGHDELADTAELERPEVGGEVPRVVATPGVPTGILGPPRMAAATTVPAPRSAGRRGPRHRANTR